jgi:hypothetical protein
MYFIRVNAATIPAHLTPKTYLILNLYDAFNCPVYKAVNCTMSVNVRAKIMLHKAFLVCDTNHMEGLNKGKPRKG